MNIYEDPDASKNRKQKFRVYFPTTRSYSLPREVNERHSVHLSQDASFRGIDLQYEYSVVLM